MASTKTYLQRNSTSFPVKVTAALRELHKGYVAALGHAGDPQALWAAALKYYQFLVRAYLSVPAFGVGAEGNARGLVVVHSTGVGKTRTAVACCMALWDERVPVVVLPHSLQKNFSDTVAQVVALVNPSVTGGELEALQKAAVARFAFVSADAYNSADQLWRAGKPHGPRALTSEFDVARNSLDGKLLIVDEAHNIFRAIINSGKETTNGRRLYDQVMEAKDLKIVFLTGTLPSKNPFELVPCFNMLAGGNLLPPRYDTFVRLYVAEGGVRNRDRLANRLAGLVSFVTPALPSEPGGKRDAHKPRDQGWFPEELPVEISRVEMSPEQYRQYRLARDKEDSEGKGGDRGPSADASVNAPLLALPGSEKKSMKSYFVKSRALSNFAPPRNAAVEAVSRMAADIFTESTSPKMALIAKRVDEMAGPALIYSQFVSIGGLAVMGRFLEKLGYERFDAEPERAKTKRARAAREAAPPAAETITAEDISVVDVPVDAAATLPAASAAAILPAATSAAQGGAATRKRYAIISGEVLGEDREIIQKTLRDPANLRGELIRAVLVSKTGAEGLDFLYIRQVHIMEPYWDRARELQVVARAVRLGSHDALPEAERVVAPFLYIGVANRAAWEASHPDSREANSIDEVFYAKAAKRHAVNTEFRSLLRAVSLECSLYGLGEDCLSCVPTDAPLFTDDPARDLRLPNPCRPLVETEVKARKLVVDGAEYYYRRESPSAKKYEFFVFDRRLGGFARVPASDPAMTALITAADSDTEPRSAPKADPDEDRTQHEPRSSRKGRSR